MFEFEDDLGISAQIKVVGVGGGGGNAIHSMMRAQLDGIDFVVVNTDIQAIQQSAAPVKIQIGHKLTRGLGAGANPEVGREAAIEDASLVQEALSGADMVFVTAGMGGGTGTGAAPVIANLAREQNALTVGVVTKPFSFEGKRRMRQAEAGIEELRKSVDTLICIPNDNLLVMADKNTPMIDSFKMADQILQQAVRGIADLITTPGLINLDFADVCSIMRGSGDALMATGVAAGDNRAIEAARHAIASPLLEDASIAGATGILLNITGPSDMTLFEVNEACKLIQEEVHEDANIIFGSVVDDERVDEVQITLIATGFDDQKSAIRQIASNSSKTRRSTVLPSLSSSTTSSRLSIEERTPRVEREPQISRPTRTAPAPRPEPRQETSSRQTELSLDLRDVFEGQSSVDEDSSKPQWGNEDRLDLFDTGDNSHKFFTEGDASFEPRSVSPEPHQPSKPPSTKLTDWGDVELHSDSKSIKRQQTKSAQESKEVRGKLAKLGSASDFDEDKYDVPAFMRRRAD